LVVKKYRVPVQLLILAALLASPGSAWPAATAASNDRPALQQVTLETRPDGVTVVIHTGPPAPRYRVSMGGGLAGEVSLHFPGAVNALPAELSATSPFLEGVTVLPDDGPPPGVVVKIRPRSATLGGFEQRDDALALRYVALGAGEGAAESDYRVGVGDKIEISVFGHDDMTRTAEVRTDGTINFPLLGDIKVAGKTPTQIDADVTRSLSQEYLVDPDVNVDVKEYKSQWVTLMGEVHTPGRYVLRRGMRLIDLLAEAGGPTKEAGTQIVLTRHEDQGSGTRQVTINIDDILNPGKPESNMTLRHGDIVTVDQREAFYIRGEVARPGPYYIERGSTVLRAIGVAGGLTQFANRKEVQLLRAGAGGIQEKTVINMKSIEDGRKEDVPILPNDVIIVPRRIF
jgi:polysaccharide export outer membrane protein